MARIPGYCRYVTKYPYEIGIFNTYRDRSASSPKCLTREIGGGRGGEIGRLARFFARLRLSARVEQNVTDVAHFLAPDRRSELSLRRGKQSPFPNLREGAPLLARPLGRISTR